MPEIGEAIWPRNDGSSPMPRYYFDCLSDQEVIPDRRGANLADLDSARDHATRIARSMMATGSSGDWSHWTVVVSAASGETLLAVAFAEALASA